MTRRRLTAAERKRYARTGSRLLHVRGGRAGADPRNPYVGPGGLELIRKQEAQRAADARADEARIEAERAAEDARAEGSTQQQKADRERAELEDRIQRLESAKTAARKRAGGGDSE